jgi:hypothetical protein
MLFIVDDEDAVGALGGTELRGLADGHRLGHGEGGQWSEGGDGASLAAGLLLPRALGSGSLPREFILNLLADGLDVVSASTGARGANAPRLAWFASVDCRRAHCHRQRCRPTLGEVEKRELGCRGRT